MGFHKEELKHRGVYIRKGGGLYSKGGVYIRKGGLHSGLSVSEYGVPIFHITRSPLFFRENIFNIPCEVSV